ASSRWSLARVLDNAGTINTTGLLYFGLGGAAGVINNLPGGLFHAQGEGNFLPGDGGADAYAFNNHSGAIFRRSGSGRTLFNLPFTSNGTVEVQEGILELAQGGSTSGVFTITAGSVKVTGNTFTVQKEASIT